MKGKSVVITEVDFDRLAGLVGSPKGRMNGASAAKLQEALSGGQVVAPTRISGGVVTMNSKVVVRDLGSREEQTCTLVYPEDADIDQFRISVLAPMGRALLGARVGEVLSVDAPAGVRRIKVERIVYQPEAAGDFHL